MLLSKTDMFEKRRAVFQQKKTPAASLFSRKQGLGVPIHIKMAFILISYLLIYPIAITNINYIDCPIDCLLIA